MISSLFNIAKTPFNVSVQQVKDHDFLKRNLKEFEGSSFMTEKKIMSKSKILIGKFHELHKRNRNF